MRRLFYKDNCEQASLRWRRVLRSAETLRRAFVDDWSFDPLYYNETASVGFLVSAAARAGLLVLPEFTESARKLPPGRTRAGRCDMWLADPQSGTDEVIEFKHRWFLPGTQKRLASTMNSAIKAAFDRDPREADERFACTIYVPWTPKPRFRTGEYNALAFKGARPRLSALIKQSDMALMMDGGDRPVTLLFRRIPRRAKSWEQLAFD